DLWRRTRPIRDSHSVQWLGVRHAWGGRNCPGGRTLTRPILSPRQDRRYDQLRRSATTRDVQRSRRERGISACVQARTSFSVQFEPWAEDHSSPWNNLNSNFS